MPDSPPRIDPTPATLPTLRFWGVQTLLWMEVIIIAVAALRAQGSGISAFFLAVGLALGACLVAVAALRGRGVALCLLLAALLPLMTRVFLAITGDSRAAGVAQWIAYAILGAGILAYALTVASRDAARLEPRGGAVLGASLRSLGLCFLAGWLLLAIDPLIALPLSGH